MRHFPGLTDRMCFKVQAPKGIILLGVNNLKLTICFSMFSADVIILQTLDKSEQTFSANECNNDLT